MNTVGYFALLVIFSALVFLIGWIVGLKPTEDRCPKCGCIVDTSYKSYEIKKCRSCKWNSEEKI